MEFLRRLYRGKSIEPSISQRHQQMDVESTELHTIWQELSQLLSDRRDMLRCVDLCKRALVILPKESNEALWAALQNELGNSLAQNPLGNRATNLEQAIHHYQLALEVRTREAFPVDWAATQNNLAVAYSVRIAGSGSDNLEQAIHHYQLALKVKTREAFPVDWAMTQNNLANAYRNRITGSRSDNLEQAIPHSHLALAVYTREADPERWATTQNNLAVAYRNRIAGSRSDNLEQAIHHSQLALEVRTREAFPVDWAGTQNNLANAYSDRIAGSRSDNLEQAIHHTQLALEVYTREADPERWATTQNNLANAYKDRIVGSPSDNLEQAIHHYQLALEVKTREAFPIEHRGTLKNFVSLYFGQKHWEKAHQVGLDAIMVGADILDVASSDAGRSDAIAQTGELYIWVAYSALRLGQYGDALAWLEAGKARLLAEALSLGDANLVLLNNEDRQLLQSLRDQVQDLEYEFRLPPSHPIRRGDHTISADLREARATLRDLTARLQVQYPGFLPEGLPLADLLAQIPADGALVAPLFTSQGSAVFVVPAGVGAITADHIVWMDDFRLDDLNGLTREKEGKPGWLRYYIDYLIVVLDKTKSKAEKHAAFKPLLDGIENVTRRLWEPFVGLIHAKLQALGINRVLLMPQGDTSFVPIHAAWHEEGGQRRYFMDDYAVRYTQSMFALDNAKRQSNQGKGALVVGVSQYGSKGDLPNTRAEAQSIATLFGVEPLLDAAASVAAVKHGAPSKAYVHLSCHGGFGWGGDVFTSALSLANEEPLPLPEIMAKLDLKAGPLVVLSACETGIVDFNNVPNEFLGLPAGFMQAGARAVISSLWSVDDRSTALLMERMYKHILNKDNPMKPADALREAQFWLRDATAREIGDYYQAYLLPRMSQSEAGQAFVEILKRAKPDDKPYSHPFYWAAFTYTGD
ncbi:MAG: CHAT domain-containing protein [Anaerolineae bacterium]|nr:CHAT domain-containing protein [Anaerolineae bacterium]